MKKIKNLLLTIVSVFMINLYTTNNTKADEMAPIDQQNNNEQPSENKTDQNENNITDNDQDNDSNNPDNNQSEQPQEPERPIRPKHKYNKVIYTKKVNYYLKFSKSNYNMYKNGAYNTKKSNIESIKQSKRYANKKTHITKIQKTKTGLYLKTSDGWINQNAMIKNARWLNVPLISQRPQLPTGCEMVATTMMLNYAGSHVNKYKVARETPRSSNPNKGFVGSPYLVSGWYVYPKGLMNVVRKHLGTAKNMTGLSLNKIKKQINKNHPVVIWLANIDGFSNHALTINGYDSKGIYLNDPWKYKKIYLRNLTVNIKWKQDAKRALSY